MARVRVPSAESASPLGLGGSAQARPMQLRTPRRGVTRALALSLSAVLAVIGCGKSSEPQRGGLVIVLETDMAIPKDIDQVSLDVEHAGDQVLHELEEIGAGQLLMPATFQVGPTGDAVPVQIHAAAYKSGQPVVERDVVIAGAGGQRRRASDPAGLSVQRSGERRREPRRVRVARPACKGAARRRRCLRERSSPTSRTRGPKRGRRRASIRSTASRARRPRRSIRARAPSPAPANGGAR